MLNMHLIGVFARPVLPGIDVGDKVIPLNCTRSITTMAGRNRPRRSNGGHHVDSRFTIAARQLGNRQRRLHSTSSNQTQQKKRVKQMSFGVTGILGIIVFLLALQPPELLIFLNLFAFGGLEAAFIWPVVLGLYWKYGNKHGAMPQHDHRYGSYIAIHFYNQANGNLLGVHTVTIPVVLSLIAYRRLQLGHQAKSIRILNGEVLFRSESTLFTYVFALSSSRKTLFTSEQTLSSSRKPLLTYT